MSDTVNLRRRALVVGSAAALAAGLAPAAHAQKSSGNAPKKTTGGLHIVFVVYPEMTLLDYVGPLAVLASTPSKISIVAKTKTPFVTASKAQNGGMKIEPTDTFESVERPDVLVVPGAANPFGVMADADFIKGVEKLGREAKWVTSVCTGSLILGAAGLIEGYRATTHWTFTDALKDFGGTYEKARVVVDRNRVTGAGVSAGIDMALKLVSILFGKDAAERSELLMEYAPVPPMGTGSPDTAPKALVEATKKAYLASLDKATPAWRAMLAKSAKKY